MARRRVSQQVGVDCIILWKIREIRGDKIVSLCCYLPEHTGPQMARFLE